MAYQGGQAFAEWAQKHVNNLGQDAIEKLRQEMGLNLEDTSRKRRRKWDLPEIDYYDPYRGPVYKKRKTFEGGGNGVMSDGFDGMPKRPRIYDDNSLLPPSKRMKLEDLDPKSSKKVINALSNILDNWAEPSTKSEGVPAGQVFDHGKHTHRSHRRSKGKSMIERSMRKARRAARARSSRPSRRKRKTVTNMTKSIVPKRGSRTGGYHSRDEVKNHDVAPVVQLVNELEVAGHIRLLNGIAQGTDSNERIGRKIRMKAIRVDGYVFAEDNTISPHVIRLSIVCDKQTNGSAPLKAEIYEATSSLSFPNMDNKGRFRILATKNVFLGANNGLTPAVPLAPGGSRFSFYIPLKGLLCHYTGTGNLVTNIKTNGLYFVMASNNASTITSNVHFTSRLTYLG
jgi:hypothetical protein